MSWAARSAKWTLKRSVQTWTLKTSIFVIGLLQTTNPRASSKHRAFSGLAVPLLAEHALNIIGGYIENRRQVVLCCPAIPCGWVRPILNPSGLCSEAGRQRFDRDAAIRLEIVLQA